MKKEFWKLYLDEAKENGKAFLKWGLLSIVVGCVVGGVSVVFFYAMDLVTNFRMEHLWIIAGLPLGGLLIVWMYRRLKAENEKGTNMVISAIRMENEIPFHVAPLISVSTVITHLFGGSVGREGAALQLGGSIGGQIGRWLRLDKKDSNIIIMCGMSAAFSTLFGTPMAAAVFSMEVVSVGIIHYAALLPCAVAAILAKEIAEFFGVPAEQYHIVSLPEFTVAEGGKIAVLAVCCAVLSILFCIMLHGTAKLFQKYFKNSYVRILVGGVIVAALTLCVGRHGDYNGAGLPVIERCMEGEVRPWDFFAKMVFTALTLGAGYKGGEIVPSLYIGATFGCLFGQLTGVSPSLCAAVGMTSLFCGVTNCPITSLLISLELFGGQGPMCFLTAVAVSYLMSGYTGLYKSQKIMYAKEKPEFINIFTE